MLSNDGHRRVTLHLSSRNDNKNIHLFQTEMYNINSAHSMSSPTSLPPRSTPHPKLTTSLDPLLLLHPSPTSLPLAIPSINSLMLPLPTSPSHHPHAATPPQTLAPPPHLTQHITSPRPTAHLTRSYPDMPPGTD